LVSVRAGRVVSRKKYSSASQRSGFSFTGVTSLSTHSRRLFAIERSRRGVRPRRRQKKYQDGRRQCGGTVRPIILVTSRYVGHVFVPDETLHIVAAVPQRWRRRDRDAPHRRGPRVTDVTGTRVEPDAHHHDQRFTPTVSASRRSTMSSIRRRSPNTLA